MAKSTTARTARKRRKASDFPLFKHARGHWCKTVKGKHRYFGRISEDPSGQKALERWLHEKDWLLAGLDPPPIDALESTSVKDIANHWIAGKKALLDAGDLAQVTFDEYYETAKFLLATIGPRVAAKTVGPRQFEKVRVELAKKYNANGQGKRIGQIRSMFVTAFEDQVIDAHPNFGRTFRKPKAAAFRKLRNERGDRTVEPDMIRALMDASNLNMKGMILLGIQAGFGNEECAALPRSAIKEGWIEFARVKSAVPRKVPLWPETIEALEECVKHATSKGEESLVFVSARGKNYVSERKNGYRVTGDFEATKKRVKRDQGIEIDRTFYDLRRTFETIAGESGDQVAVDTIMGHTPSESNMAARYRQRVSEERLVAVTQCVREWVYGKEVA